MIHKMKFQNFKCYDNHDIILSKINLITGVNSSGKSSIIQAILLFKEKSDTQNLINLRNINEQLDLIGYKNIINNDAEDDFFSIEINSYEKKYTEFLMKNTPINNVCQMINQEKENLLRDIVFFSAERGLSNNQIERKQDKEYKPQTLDNDALANFIKINDDIRNALSKKISFTLTEIGITNSKFQVIEYRGIYRILLENKELNNVGTGVKYVLPIIVASLTCKDKIICIENPEIHLHPAAQTKFMNFLVSSALKNNNQLIVETHSDHVLNGLRVLSKQGEIDPRDSKIIFVDSNHTINTIEIDKNGRLSKGFNGFFDEFEKQLMELI